MNYKSLPYDTAYFNNPINNINELIIKELYYVEEELLGREEGYVGLVMYTNVEKNTFDFKPLYQRSIHSFVRVVDKKKTTLDFRKVIIIGHQNNVSTHTSKRTLEPKCYMCEEIMNESDSTMVCDNPEHRVHLGCVNKYYKEYNPEFACELCRNKYLLANDRARVEREWVAFNERKENERKAKEQMNIDVDADSEDDLIGVNPTKKQREPIYTFNEIANLYPDGYEIITLGHLINNCSLDTVIQAYFKTSLPKNNEQAYKNIGEFKLSKIYEDGSADLDYTHGSGGLARVINNSKTNPYLFVVNNNAQLPNNNRGSCIISGGKIKRLRSKRRKYKKTCKPRPRKKHLRTRRCKSTRKRR